MKYFITSPLGNSITTGEITDGAVTNVKVNAAAALAYSKLAACASANLIVGSAGGVPTVTAVTGDMSITNAGLTAVSDLTITSEATGDILYFDGSNWLRLAADAGKFLKSGTPPVWDTPAGGGAYDLISTTTVSGSAVTEIDITSLDMNTDGHYMLMLRFTDNGSGSIRIFVNGDTTAGNYYSQFVKGSSTTASAVRNNYPYIDYLTAELIARVDIFISPDGYFCYVGETIADVTSSIAIQHVNGGKTNATVANITQLTVTHSAANGIGIGSTLSLYKLGV